MLGEPVFMNIFYFSRCIYSLIFLRYNWWNGTGNNDACGSFFNYLSPLYLYPMSTTPIFLVLLSEDKNPYVPPSKFVDALLWICSVVMLVFALYSFVQLFR